MKHSVCSKIASIILVTCYLLVSPAQVNEPVARVHSEDGGKRDQESRTGVTPISICGDITSKTVHDPSDLAVRSSGTSSRSERGATPVLRSNTASSYVVPIDWSKLKRYGEIKSKSRELTDCAAIFQNTIRYNLGWTTNAIGKLDGRIPFVGLEGLQGRNAHDFIRPICNMVFGYAVAFKSGLYDEQVLGVSKNDALLQTLTLIRGAAWEHKGAAWERPWQSSLWAAYLGQGAWMLWDELDSDMRGSVAELVEWEANRLATNVVPYWNGQGGDTKAEENAWNSMALSLAVAMMPKHPHVRAWKEKCSEFMVSAYATEADLKNNRRVDGKTVKDWLHGFNANPDGLVVNHGFLHPDYTLCVRLNLRAFVIQPLANQAVPQAADFNAARVYRALVTSELPSPPYVAPGGTMYRPGEPYLYYPVKADWGRVDCLTPYCLDVYSWTLGLDRGLPHHARDWMRIRAAKILEMQQRHEDLRVYADGESDKWPGREQTACGRLGVAFLTLWMHTQNYPVRQANWLSSH